ncbi:MAG: orotidine-5'-phosphate decarboxylase [Proteobacteria bacterium]|nr:orotidine-5'-phosphate decarboxylase [Pseudomonadota bacterium]
MQMILCESFRRLNHPFCIGFDPDTSDLHPFLATQNSKMPKAEFLFEWYQAVADSAGTKAGSLKLQSAFFEAAGPEGIDALKQVIKDGKSRGLYVILDAKRGDISSTMAAYGKAAFDTLGADALTILPWMGLDALASLEPWLSRGQSVYTVWLSSNVAGRALQEAILHDRQVIAAKMFLIWEDWIQSHRFEPQCGYVLGATSVPPWVQGRLQNRSHSLLMPGLGAQGGSLTDEIRSLHRQHQSTVLPLSRAILKIDHTEEIQSWADYGKQVQTNLSRYINEWQAV